MILYKPNKEIFIVVDEDCDEIYAFHSWMETVIFLTDEMTTLHAHIIPVDETTWREPKDREECFDFLFNMDNIDDLNNSLLEYYKVRKVAFS